jgi:hypothetical protein
MTGKNPIWWYWYRLKRSNSLSSEWKNYEDFAKWLNANGYDHKFFTLRVQSEKGKLGPNNCEIVLRKKFAVYDGEVKSLRDIAKKTGIGENVLRRRLGLGYSVKCATKAKVQTWFRDILGCK